MISAWLHGMVLAFALTTDVVEIEPGNYHAFAKAMLNLPFGQIGVVTERPQLTVAAEGGRAVIDANLDVLKQAWQKTFDW